MCNLGRSPSVLSSSLFSHTAPVCSETPVCMSVHVHTCSSYNVRLNHSPSYTLEGLSLEPGGCQFGCSHWPESPMCCPCCASRTGDKQLHPPCPALFMDAEKKAGSYLTQDVLRVIELTKMVLKFWSSYLDGWDYSHALHHLAPCGAGKNSGHHVCQASTRPTQMLGQACVSPLPYQCWSAF